jgi:hypothetical protein
MNHGTVFRRKVEALLRLLEDLGCEHSIVERYRMTVDDTLQCQFHDGNDSMETEPEKLRLKQVLSHKVLTVRIDSERSPI